MNSIKHSRVPIFFIHSDKDAMVSVSMAYKLYDSARCKKKLFIVKGAGHAQVPDKEPEKYWHTVSEFISSSTDIK